LTLELREAARMRFFPRGTGTAAAARRVQHSSIVHKELSPCIEDLPS
jgi:hypothetical protein